MRFRIALLLTITCCAASLLVQATPASAASAADLSLTSSASPNPVLAGNELTYTFTVDNAGPNGASDVRVGTVVPEGTVFRSVSTTKGTCTAPPAGRRGLVVCRLGGVGHLADNRTETVTLTVQVVSLEGDVTDLAKVVSATPDPDGTDNSASTTTTITPRVVDLSVDMSGPSTVASGTKATYTLLVRNEGPNGALNGQLVDRLPAGSTFVKATTSQGSCQGPAVGANGRVQCGLGRVRVGGAAAVVTIVVKVTAIGGQVANLAQVRTKALDGDRSDNRDGVATSVTPPPGVTPPARIFADLALTNVGATLRPQPGGRFRYHLTVGNAGPSPAPGVVLDDPVPEGTTFVSAQSDHGTCSTPPVGGQGTLSCSFDTIPVSEAYGVDLVVQLPPSSAPIQSTATLQHDPRLVDATITDKAATLMTPVVEDAAAAPTTDFAQADVSVTDVPKTGTSPGEIAHLIDATNLGPNTAPGTAVTVTFAKGTTVVRPRVQPSVGTVSYSTNGRVLTWTIGSLSKGAANRARLVVPTTVDLTTIKANLLAYDIGSSFGPHRPVLANAATSIVTVAAEAYDPDPSDNRSAALLGPSVRKFTVEQIADDCADKWAAAGKLLGGVGCSAPKSTLISGIGALGAVAGDTSGVVHLAGSSIWSTEIALLASQTGLRS